MSTMSNLVWLDGSLFWAAIPPYQFFFINDARLNTISCAVLTRTGGISPRQISAIYEGSTASLPIGELSNPATNFCPMLVPVFHSKDSVRMDDPAYFFPIPDGEYL